MTKITIAGGGLAGSLMAVYLGKRGFDVELYERRLDMRKNLISAGKSINLALSTRGLNALEKVGLRQAILDHAIPMHGRMIHDPQGIQKYQPYGKEGQYINSVSRGMLNILLLELADELPNVKIFFEHRCTEVDSEKGIAWFENNEGISLKVKSDYIIGGDGAFSAVRLRMMQSERYDYSQEYQKHGYKELTIAPKNGGFAMKNECLHIWPRREYMLIALPNPDKTFTCTLFFPYEGPDSFASIKTEADLLKFFNTNFPDAVPLMPDLVEDFFANPTGDLVTVRCFPWVTGKTILIGDAAHAVVPFYGQGMNCAFEDCVELDVCLEKYLPDWKKALDTYQKIRKPNADAIADLAIQNFIEMRDKVGDADFLHFKKLEHDLCELYPHSFKSQYEMVSFTLESYVKAKELGAANTRLVKYLIEFKLEDRIKDAAFMEQFFENFRNNNLQEYV
jgi:kynurenine 3-monooxygenase